MPTSSPSDSPQFDANRPEHERKEQSPQHEDLSGLSFFDLQVGSLLELPEYKQELFSPVMRDVSSYLRRRGESPQKVLDAVRGLIDTIPLGESLDHVVFSLHACMKSKRLLSPTIFAIQLLACYDLDFAALAPKDLHLLGSVALACNATLKTREISTQSRHALLTDLARCYLDLASDSLDVRFAHAFLHEARQLVEGQQASPAEALSFRALFDTAKSLQQVHAPQHLRPAILGFASNVASHLPPNLQILEFVPVIKTILAEIPERAQAPRVVQMLKDLTPLITDFIEHGATAHIMTPWITAVFRANVDREIVALIRKRLQAVPRDAGRSDAALKSALDETFQNALTHLAQMKRFPYFLEELRQVKDGKTKVPPERTAALLAQYAATIEAFLLAHAQKPEEALARARRLAQLTGQELDRVMWNPDPAGNAEHKRWQTKVYGGAAYFYRDNNDEEAFLPSWWRRERSQPRLSPLRVVAPPVRRSLHTWQRFADIHFGYGALLYESMRSPVGEQSLLMRFGLDLGQVRALNVRDANAFPGRGIAIFNLRPELALASSSEGLDPYAAYKEAWPHLAQAIDDMPYAEFIFARGMIVVSCRKTPQYSLEGHDGKREQYSLVIFNSHFGNLLGKVASLVPSRILAQVFSASLSPVEDFVGFDSTRANLNSTLPSPEALLKIPGVIPIGEPRSLTHGFWSSPHAEFFRQYEGAVQLLRQHDAAVKAWDQEFVKKGLASMNYQREVELHRDAARLREMFREIQDMNDGEALDLCDQLMNLMDLFRIFQAQWHRGYTRSRNSSIETAVEQEFASASEEEAFVNPHAARMLRAALEFHQGKDALPPGKRPPRLAIANALSYADQPEPGMYLDTADMSLHLGKKVIPFSTDRISMEEELFWSEKIIRERAADKPNRILDLRFYSPDAVEW